MIPSFQKSLIINTLKVFLQNFIIYILFTKYLYNVDNITMYTKLNIYVTCHFCLDTFISCLYGN